MVESAPGELVVGHITDDIDYNLYSGAVAFEMVKCAFTEAKIYHLEVMVADVNSAYLLANYHQKSISMCWTRIWYI